MISENLFSKILLEPALAAGCNKLNIISGYASPAMANKHIASLPAGISINLLVGMVPNDGIGRGGHNGFQALDSALDTFNCNYVINRPGVHVKSYIWLKDNTPKIAFTGSGNYSQNAFMGGTVESFAEDNPIDCNDLFNSISGNSLNCLDANIETKIKFYEEIYKRNILTRAFEDAHATEENPLVITADCVNLSLLVKATGETHNAGAGLNWGQPTLTRRRGSPDEAYIGIPAQVLRSGFFPPKTRHFTMITDDGQSFDMVVAQMEGKALETPRDNSILGKYFRNRLGVPLGSFVNKQDLLHYGRTDVKICKIDDETYFMDFSV